MGGNLNLEEKEVSSSGEVRRLSVTREGEFADVPTAKKTLKKGTANKVKTAGNPWLVLGVLGGTVILSAGAGFAARFSGIKDSIVNPKVIEVRNGPDETVIKREIDWTRLQRDIENVIASSRGRWSVYVYDMEGKEGFGIDEEKVMTAASLIKLPVIVLAFAEAEKGTFDLDGKYTLSDNDKVGGAGSMAYASAGTVYSFRKMVELMGQQSDNTAFSVIVKKFGKNKVETEIEAMGMASTSYAENKTTAKDVGRLLEKLYGEELLNRKNTTEVLRYLTKTIFEDRIPAGLPEDTRVAHKVGTEVGVVADAGVVFAEHPYILVVLSEEENLNEGNKIIVGISTMVWDELGKLR